MQHAVNQQARVDPLEIDPVLLRAIAVQVALLAMELAELIRIGLVKVFGQEIEFAQNLELEHFRQLRQLGGAAVVEDDLEHVAYLLTRPAINCQSRGAARRRADTADAPRGTPSGPAATRR